MSREDFYVLQEGNIYAVPIFHSNMETAAAVFRAFHSLQPDCVAVEYPEPLSDAFLEATARLPDVTVLSRNQAGTRQLFLCEPCDGALEALRCAQESHCDAYCIDLDLAHYPLFHESFPDPYAIHRIGLEKYYNAYRTVPHRRGKGDLAREEHMARFLKGLALRYERVLFIGGMHHIENVLQKTRQSHFEEQTHAPLPEVSLSTLTEQSCREVLSEFPWISERYEEERSGNHIAFWPDRQQMHYQLLQAAAEKYRQETSNPFHGTHLRNTMKFLRNYALSTGKLQPDLFQLLTAAKGCVDHNYSYEVWALATEYAHLRNIDNLPVESFSVEDIWGQSKKIFFHLKQKNAKSSFFNRRQKEKCAYRFQPPGPFSLCSYPQEDVVIENFGTFLRKKGTRLLQEEGERTIPFSTSLEEGVDMRETLRNWHVDRRLYVKTRSRPPSNTGSVVVIFDEDNPRQEEQIEEKFPWCMTWLGEHDQESDMAFYSTPMSRQLVGPGIARCEYGGFMMSYPPRRMQDVWSDPDYFSCRSKAEVLLVAGIDYAVEPLVVYVAAQPPRSKIRSLAQRFGKKIVYVPLGQLSASLLHKLRFFHVLDGHDKRKIADEYIF